MYSSSCNGHIHTPATVVHTAAAVRARAVGSRPAASRGAAHSQGVNSIHQHQQQQQCWQQKFSSGCSLRSFKQRLVSRSSSSRACSSHVCCAAAAEAAEAATAADLDPRVYTDGSVIPKPFAGPVAAAFIPGKGRGLVATAPLHPGQLLLVTPPIVLVEGDLGDIPNHDELQEVISSSGMRFNTWQAQWLKTLVSTVDGEDDSSGSSSNDGSSSSSVLVDLPELLPPESQQASCWEATTATASSSNNAAAACDAAAGGSSDGVLYEDLNMSEEQLWGAIVLNCYGEGFQDLPATICCDGPLNSQLGLWGPFALLNHSCSPNAVNFTLRDFMIVRATSPIALGDEITINYLGRGALRPLSQRQQELEACYGFRCNCERCQTESRVSDLPTAAGSTLGLCLDQIQEKIGTVYEPLLQQCIHDLDSDSAEQGDNNTTMTEEKNFKEELVQLAADMQEDLDDLMSPFSSSSSSDATSDCARILSSLSSPAAAAAWTQASAFDLMGLLQEALAAADQPDDVILHNLVRICQQVCPGSDLHVFQALRHLSKTQQRLGLECDESQAAMNMLVTALCVRYGQQVVRDELLLQRMVAAASKAADMVAF